MKIAFQMEALENADWEFGASPLLVHEACRRGFEVFHYLQESLTLGNDGVYASAARTNVDLASDKLYEQDGYKQVDLTSFDVVFMRQEPPFDMNYITATYMLERLKEHGVFVTNDPFWIRNLPEKLCIFDFKKYMPPTLVSRHMPFIEAFFKEHGDVVIKPLYLFKGKGIIRTSSVEEAKEQLRQTSEPLMFQRFIPEIAEGNKRIILFDGEVVGTLKSVPQGEEFRVYRDSVDLPYEPSEEELSLAKEIGNALKKRGQHFAGIDLVGPYLIEINVTCTASLTRLNGLYDKKYESLLWDLIERKISKQEKISRAV